MPDKIIRVGVAVAILNNHNQLLIGRRLSEFGKGKYHLPGGKLEYHEHFKDCAVREVFEEAGFDIPIPSHIFTSNDIYLDAHWITFFYGVKLDDSPMPINKEPDKCENWNWVDTDILRLMGNNLFLPLNKLIESKEWSDFNDITI